MSDSPTAPPAPEEREPTPEEQAFLAVVGHRAMLAAYIRAIVADPHLAEDVLSETTLAIVRSWDRYDRSKPFPPWARGVARFTALAALRRHRRLGAVTDEATLEMLAGALDETCDSAVLAERKERLRSCIGKLPTSQQKLVKLRYFEDCSYERISEVTGRATSALYMAFSRIHAALARCVGGERPKAVP